VEVVMARTDVTLLIEVTDDGVGLPEDFDLDRSTGLGLSIVRTLVETELEGELRLERASGAPPRIGTVVRVSVSTAAW
jgi:two-component sensor histidine kinase